MHNASGMHRTVAGIRAIARVLLPLILLAGSASAARIDFKVSHDGQPLQEAEVCFFALPLRTPGLINRLFHGEDIECLPADRVLEIPPGDWFYFVRHSSGFISDYLPQVSMAINAPDHAYKIVHEDVVPAGTVRVDLLLETLESDERLAIITESSHVGTIVLPLVADETAFLAPAGAKFVIAVVRAHRPARLSPVMSVAAHETVDVRPWPDRPALVHDVMAWISFPPALRNLFGEAIDHLDPPNVALEVNGRTFLPTFMIHTRALAETLLLFKEVPRTPADIRLGGKFWMADVLHTGTGSPVEVIEDALVTEPAGAIRAVFGVPPRHSPLSCNAPLSPPSAEILSCTDNQEDACQAMRKAALPESGEIDFDGLKAGGYVIAFDAALGGAPQRRPIQVDVGATTTVLIDSDFYSFYGTVFLGDQPVSRALSFSGRGTAVSDALDGRYDVTFPGASPPPPAAVIRVTNCDDENDLYMHVTTSAPKRGERFDIVIPDNSLRVTLFASGSRKRIAGAVSLVSYEGDSDQLAHFARKYPVDAAGTVAIQHIVTTAAITLCGESDGYERKCLPRFRMGNTDRLNLEIELTESVQLRGRIALPSPIEFGRLWFVNDQGTVTEWAAVKPDGSFAFKVPHTSRDYAVITSGTFPLAVLQWPNGGAADTVELTYPAGRRRDLEVRMTAPGSSSGVSLLGLMIGDKAIPTEGFAYHQGLRGASHVMTNGQPFQISDVLESAPISVVLGPDPIMEAGRFPIERDWISVMSYLRSRPRLPVDSSGVVTFDR